MSELIDRIDAAEDWHAYYIAYANAYQELLANRLALGRVDLAGQLHHTAIPDASGVTCGMVNWAVYSEPSAETLRAFLGVFRELVTAQPHRIRSSRYIFAVPQGKALAYPEARRTLGGEGYKLDYYCDSLADALSVPPEYGPIDSINILLGADVELIDRHILAELGKQSPDFDSLRSLRDRLLEFQPHQMSVISGPLIQLIIDSSFVLASFRLGLTAEQAAIFCGERGGIGGQIARARAEDSGWGEECAKYCWNLLAQCPIQSVEYVVKPGDMLGRIVRQNYTLSFDKLWPIIRVLNPDIRDANVIRAGERLRLPKLS